MGRWNTEQGLGAKGMIDTDKYEGHTPAPWLWHEGVYTGIELMAADDQCRTVKQEVKVFNTKADAELIKDAPRILEAYKRLRKQLEDCKRQIQFTADWIRDRGEDTHAKELDEFLGWME